MTVRRTLALAACLGGMLALASLAHAASVATDAPDYAPGSTATITGDGWEPNSDVLLQVTHSDGTAEPGEGHDPWLVTSDADGNISTTWYVNPDDSAGSSFRLTADQDGVHVEMLFTDTDPNLGAGRVTSVTPLDGGCVAAPTGSGTQSWDIQQGKTYSVTLSNVTESLLADANTIGVMVKHSDTSGNDLGGNSCVTATRTDSGTFQFQVTLPNTACYTYPILYGVDVNNCMPNSGFFARRSDGGNHEAHLRAATFGSDCSSSPTPDTNCTAPPAPPSCSITPPADLTPTTDAGHCYVSNVNLGQATAGSGCTTPTASGAPDNGQYPLGETIITWSTTCGTSNCTATQKVTVTDEEKPTISCPATIIVDCAGAVPPADISQVTTSDNCGGVTVSVDKDVITDLGCPNHFDVARTYRATDSHDNIASCTQTIHVEDTTGPTLSAHPVNATYTCRALVPPPATLTADDNCDHGLTVTRVDAESNPLHPNCENTITRTWTAVDACSHSTSWTQSIYVNDTDSPALVGVPADTGFQCYASVPGPAAVTASDICDPNISVSFSETQSNPGMSCNNLITRTWTATNGCGHVTSATQHITCNDTTSPTVSVDLGVPSSIQLKVGNACPATLLYSVNTNDNCGNPTLTQTPASGSALGLGTTTVTCTVTDACGNSATDSSKSVTVRTSIRALKFYDRNTNGVQDSGEPGIANWQFAMNNTTAYTDNGGNVDFLGLGAGTFTVSEVKPNSNWLPTTATSQTVTYSASDFCPQQKSFGNVCQGPGGGLTLGFWSNKNGQAIINGDSGVYTFLDGLNLRNSNGTAFDPTAYAPFRSWLLGATATNMAYMLSAQLTAMELNVREGKVNGSGLIYAPNTNSANNAGFASVNAVMAEANTSLGSYGSTPDGNSERAHQEALKTALDNANNNLTFVQALPCSFTSPY